jgi:hypothetical protein
VDGLKTNELVDVVVKVTGVKNTVPAAGIKVALPLNTPIYPVTLDYCHEIYYFVGSMPKL